MASEQAAADIGVRRRAAHDAEEDQGGVSAAARAGGRPPQSVASAGGRPAGQYVVIYGGPDGTPMTPGEFQPRGASWLPCLGEEPVAMEAAGGSART
ncbi:MAG: hypothetical protein R2734_02770 [Nocardioides sp.]